MRTLRVFLSSPSDVAEERVMARRFLKEVLPYDPLLRGRVAFEVVSWDDPSAQIPMIANITPQEAINRFGPKPSQCDIVIIILWSRLGTHLDMSTFRKPDDKPYLSGTEWEFEDAWNAKPQPKILVYRRIEKPVTHLDDPCIDDKRLQFGLVNQFFARFSNPDGSYRSGWSQYETPARFRERLDTDLKHLLRYNFSGRNGPFVEQEPKPPTWTGSPYPGLRAFTTAEAPIFFGRAREVDAITERLRDPSQRFMAVVGASGTGKSSLIRAGIIPLLTEVEFENSQQRQVVSFTPGAVGGNPFLALAIQLHHLLPFSKGTPTDIATGLLTASYQLGDYVTAVLPDSSISGVLLLFVDQLEELWTPASRDFRKPFIKLLSQAGNNPGLRVLVTLRADFLPQCMAEPDLAELLQKAGAIFPLGHPGPAALTRMIEGPAERAGVKLEDGLADQILKDAGAEAGVLPLVAFTLEELYRQEQADRSLTLAGYSNLGALHGAIGRQADALVRDIRRELGIDVDEMLQQVFAALVHVDDAGTVTRHRALRSELMDESTLTGHLVERLINGRLLLAEDIGPEATIMLAHEALIQQWPTLNTWLDRNRAQMQLFHRLQLMLVEPEPLVRRYALEALGDFRSATGAVVSELTRALKDPNEHLRLTAVQSLARIGPAAERAISALIAAFGDEDHDVRGAAVQALKNIKPGAEALPILINALVDRDKIVRTTAALALSDFGPEADGAVQPLVANLVDTDAAVRVCMAHALGAVGPRAAAAIPALVDALNDIDQAVRRSARYGLDRIVPAGPHR
jgi:hypothetical protein